MANLEALRQGILPVLLPWGVKRIAVFGSVAGGEDTPESTVDVLVDLKDSGERPVIGLKWFEIERDLSHALGRNVCLVNASVLKPSVRELVEAHMVVLYDEP